MASNEKLLFGDEQTQAAGRELATQLHNENQLASKVITLSGELGAGKSTFCRGFIAACGFSGSVKSPTYTLIENYSTEAAEIGHLDLYRLNDPDELEYIGFRDLLESDRVLLIEWPERMAPFLPADRLDLVFAPIDEVRCPDLRRITLTAPDRGSWGHRLRTLAGAGLAADQEVAP